ncbi:hypothetical protein [Variovorax sp. UMC13]|uniref:hypothetical protein n=1 Tax=Variovorax sp. UMC13 TaxID=1862326 RepID=UPI001603335F|nr:hypothetical protein [Variovorax sp. UMC13]
MASTGNTTMPSDELQDFWRECAAAGFNQGDFMVSATETIPNEPGPIKRTVVITRTVKGKPIGFQYDGSSGSDWIAPAVADVKSGTFGPA